MVRMDASYLRARLAAAIAAGCAACRSADPAPTTVPVAETTAAPVATAVPVATVEGPARPATGDESEASEKSEARTADPEASAPAGGACQPGQKQERYCLDRGAKPPRMLPDPKFTFDANRCVIAKEIVDTCSGITAVRSGPAVEGNRCCYAICRGPVPPCGRPLVDATGAARVSAIVARAGWEGRTALVPGSRSAHPAAGAIRDAWLADAAMEHASVAAFGRFALELLAVGAPSELVEDAHRAAIEEIEHARLCLAVAAAFDASPVPLGPGPLPLGAVGLRGDLASVAASAAEESCCGEVFAALALSRARDACADDAVRSVLSRIAEDEARHGELGFRFVAWAWQSGDAAVRMAIERGFERGLARIDTSAVGTGELGEGGRLGARELARASHDARSEVIAPSLARLRGTVRVS
jgi:hypothetical protein